MNDALLNKLTEGTVLEGPHWTEPVKVLTAKARGSRIEVQAVGTHTKRLWTKLLKREEFDDTIKVTQAGELAALNGNPTHFRLAAEAHRIRLAFQYDPHFAVSVSQVDPLPHQMDAVYTHLLAQPRIRFLIADDPGAGKTIMAGLAIKELKFRGLIERTLIITPDELKLYDAVTQYVQQNFQRAEAAENRNVGLALTVLQRRLASSLAAIRSSLERRRKRLKDLQKLGKLRQEYGELPDDLDDLTEAERWRFEDDLVERLTMAENMAELEAEIEELDRLVQLARHTEKNVTETKFEELRSVISNHISGRAERLLIFTEHKDTLDFLVGKLTNLGFHCCTIHGGMALEKRIDAEREFFEHKPSVMVATEAAGEGINLQFCSLMVNYDIPWNPNRLEQRMGRIHRYKQEREAMIWNIVAQNTREGEVMECLLHKLEDMRLALGSDRVYDVIGEIIPAPRFDALMKDWLSRRRTMTEILAEIELQTDVEHVARIKADMDDKALGSRYIDMSKLCADVRQSRENRLMPEYIERFFLEAWRSFGGTIAPVKERNGVWSINRVPPDLRKLPDALERKYGKIGNTYPLLTFDKELLIGYSDLEFVGPGHPLFEGVVERVLKEYGHAPRQGAVFYNADATEPTVLWLLKCGVEDGRGQMVGARLFAIHRTGDTYRKSQPYALLDLKPPEGDVACPAPVRQAATDEDQIIDWSLAEVTPGYFGEIETRRQKELGIKEKYVRKSLQFLMGESIKKIASFDKQLREIRDESDARRLNIAGNRAKEEARKGELSQRLKDRLAEIEQEQHLSEKPPEILGVAVILPAPREVVRSVDGMENDPEVERIAVDLVMKYEHEQGRKPVSVEEENCGWDVSSLLDGQVERYIEVKGRAGQGGVALTPNEWIKAQRFGKDYWLYVVVNCKTNPRLYLIQDPASKLNPREDVSVVRYMVGLGDWKQAAASTEGSHP